VMEFQWRFGAANVQTLFELRRQIPVPKLARQDT
jgi:hypothetical protein